MAERGNKLVLDNRELTEMFFLDTRVLGIMAPVKDYQFCWFINTSTGLDFRLNPELEIKLIRKKRDYFFSLYEYNEPNKFLSHYIYKNHFDGEYLLPEFKHLDFLWLMKGDEVSDEALQETVQTIRSIQQVQLVAELTVDKISNKENLVF
ncbi:MAG: IPExxxVDY family protein [Chitinophagaceae bacterium]|nr:IPExxxVDY family protein [Chitinophagaceae bacterium]MBP6588889.1 IPExxxVDY family protein [Chitinophagaceae bacterium]